MCGTMVPSAELVSFESLLLHQMLCAGARGERADVIAPRDCARNSSDECCKRRAQHDCVRMEEDGRWVRLREKMATAGVEIGGHTIARGAKRGE